MAAKYGAIGDAPGAGGIPTASVPIGIQGKGANDDGGSYGKLLAKDTTSQVDGNPFGKGSRRTDNNRAVTVLLVLNYMIGSGILNTCQTFRDSGIAATTVLYIVACEFCVSTTQ